MSQKKYSLEFKAKVAIEAIKGEETTSQIASRYGLHPSQVRAWKREFLSNNSLTAIKKNYCNLSWFFCESVHLSV